MFYKDNWEETKRHFQAFWSKDYEKRCCLSLRICDKENASKDFPIKASSLEEQYLSPDYLYQRYIWEIERTTYIAEALPCYYLNFGTAGHAAYFGAHPHYKEDTIWFEPTLSDPNIKNLQYDVQERTLQNHKEIAGYLANRAKGKFLIGMPDNCGNIDALAQLRGSENLLIDMLESPDFVHQACQKITEVWKTTQRQFFDILAENNEGGSSHGWMQLWCPKRHAQIQCDFSVMISPEMFEEFVLPEIEACSRYLDYTTYHLDGQEQIRHLDMILSCKDLDNIQWTPVAGQPKTSSFIQELQKIQKAGKGLILLPEKSEVPFLLENLSHRGLHLVVNGEFEKEEAEDLIQLAEQLAH